MEASSSKARMIDCAICVLSVLAGEAKKQRQLCVCSIELGSHSRVSSQQSVRGLDCTNRTVAAPTMDTRPGKATFWPLDELAGSTTGGLIEPSLESPGQRAAKQSSSRGRQKGSDWRREIKKRPSSRFVGQLLAVINCAPSERCQT